MQFNKLNQGTGTQNENMSKRTSINNKAVKISDQERKNHHLLEQERVLLFCRPLQVVFWQAKWCRRQWIGTLRLLLSLVLNFLSALITHFWGLDFGLFSSVSAVLVVGQDFGNLFKDFSAYPQPESFLGPSQQDTNGDVLLALQLCAWHLAWSVLLYQIEDLFLQAYTYHDIIITRCHSISLCLVVCIIIYFVKWHILLKLAIHGLLLDTWNFWEIWWGWFRNLCSIAKKPLFTVYTTTLWAGIKHSLCKT